MKTKNSHNKRNLIAPSVFQATEKSVVRHEGDSTSEPMETKKSGEESNLVGTFEIQYPAAISTVQHDENSASDPTKSINDMTSWAIVPTMSALDATKQLELLSPTQLTQPDRSARLTRPKSLCPTWSARPTRMPDQTGRLIRQSRVTESAYLVELVGLFGRASESG